MHKKVKTKIFSIISKCLAVVKNLFEEKDYRRVFVRVSEVKLYTLKLYLISTVEINLDVLNDQLHAVQAYNGVDIPSC